MRLSLPALALSLLVAAAPAIAEMTPIDEPRLTGFPEGQVADIYGVAIGMTAEEADAAMRASLVDIEAAEIVPTDGTTPQRQGFEISVIDAGIGLETAEGFRFAPSFTGHVWASEKVELQYPGGEPTRGALGNHFRYQASSPLTGQTVESLMRSSYFPGATLSREATEAGVLEKYGEPSHIQSLGGFGPETKTFFYAFKNGEKLVDIQRHSQTLLQCFEMSSAPRALKDAKATGQSYFGGPANLDRYRGDGQACDAGISVQMKGNATMLEGLTIHIFDNLAAVQDHEALGKHFEELNEAYLTEFKANAAAPKL